MTMENKNVLISVSYGALDNAALDADVGRIETAMLNALPGWHLSRAFTSARVRSLLSKRGKEVPDAAGAIAQARAEGAEHIALATLLISPGEEYEGVLAAADGLPVASPLLAEDEDLDALAAYYAGVQHDCGTPLLLMGHGHPSNGNPAYQRLRQRLPEQVYLACLSGADNLTALLPELLSQPVRRITLEPLLMSVGGHTLRDMAGEEPGSWKSQLEKAGFTVDCHLTGMGRLEIAQRIYARKLRSLIG